ncbi:hypothetical protein VagYM19_22850 [Vibrio alginolyticus]|nr:hypothetical protein Vag1382_22820 [Vibrio alginolyticus]BCB47756.1 hypothetical protein VagVIO5_22820 [Vibrio alginolyticus]BCB52358.1 hypothetical protein VagYM19_22850 [Vibrio alginolyticus]BCB56961.1 hypothetical protein VagYM4_22840 [Vibrio alginolyticus]
MIFHAMLEHISHIFVYKLLLWQSYSFHIDTYNYNTYTRDH